MKHVVIVGAGVSGLATAFHLGRIARERGVELRATVLESASRPGGRVWTERTDGFQVELGANGFLDSKRSTLELCQQLGLGNQLIAARPEARTRFLFWNGRLHPLPTSPASLLTSGLLSLGGKVRLLCERFIAARREAGDETVHEFAARRIGAEAAGVLIDALVTGIHAGDPTLLSAPAAFPRMIALEREYGSLMRAMSQLRKKRRAEPPNSLSPQSSARGGQSGNAGLGPAGVLWSLRDGMGQLIESLAESCGDGLVRGVEVKQVRPNAENGWSVQAAGRDEWSADAVVLACPSFVQSRLVAAFDADLARLLGEIRYNSVVVVALGFRRNDIKSDLAGFGYLSPQRTRRDVLGVLWNSTIFDHRAPAGMVLFEAMCGGWNRPDIVGWDDDRVVRTVREELRASLQIETDPVLVRIVRWPQAIPQYHVGHLDRLAAIECRRRQHPGLVLTGNSFRGIAVNDCAEEAVRCAAEVVGHLAAAAVTSRS
jgi:oxygen-dependent protoporphyrinogen oxidase